MSSSPITKTYNLGPVGVIECKITGDDRATVNVTVSAGSSQVWSGTLMQAVPDATTPELILGNTTVEAGAKFHLTIPTSTQQGSVSLNCTIKSGDNDPTPFAAQVATWSLSDGSGS